MTSQTCSIETSPI